MRQPYQTGVLAEWLCVARLWLSGWRILARRWQSPAGEIDLIATRGQTISFIEVKARHSHDAAISSLSATQRQRISHAANHWLALQAKLVGASTRFDVMSVSRWPWPKWHRNVF